MLIIQSLRALRCTEPCDPHFSINKSSCSTKSGELFAKWIMIRSFHRGLFSRSRAKHLFFFPQLRRFYDKNVPMCKYRVSHRAWALRNKKEIVSQSKAQHHEPEIEETQKTKFMAKHSSSGSLISWLRPLVGIFYFIFKHTRPDTSKTREKSFIVN